MNNFKNVVIWGHKLGTHTHSYVHNSFYETFKYMGYNTYHLDDNDNIGNIDFSNSLFITEGQVCSKIPMRNDCKYILHNCNTKVFDEKNIKYINIQVLAKNTAGEKINNYTYFDGKTLFQPWATDLLPEQIVPNNETIENSIYYIGTVNSGGWNNAYIDCLNFAKAADTKGLNFYIFGGYTGNDINEYIVSKSGMINNEDAIRYVKKSYLAPIFQGSNQQTLKYVPCRLFKNISYGQVALTNCDFLENFFEEEPIIYNKDTYQLFFDAEEKKETQNLKLLMQIVKEKHTFVNRINQILEVL